MAISTPVARGTNQIKTSGTTLTISPSADIVAGRSVLFWAVSDNAAAADGDSTLHSVADTDGNTWTRLREWTEGTGGANNGVTASLWLAYTTSTISTSDVVTLTLGSARTAKVCGLVEVAEELELDATSGNPAAASAGGTAVSVSSPTLPSEARLMVALLGVELNSLSITNDADYTLSNNIRTTGGGGATNVSGFLSYRLATLTSDTYNATITSADWVAILAALNEVPAGPTTWTGTASTSLSVSASSTGRKTAKGTASTSLSVAASSTGVRTRLGSGSVSLDVAASAEGEIPGAEAVAPAALTAGYDPNNRTVTNYVTASHSVTGGRRVLLFVALAGSTDTTPVLPTIAGHGAFWSLVADQAGWQASGNAGRRTLVYQAVPVANSTGTITISPDGTNLYASCGWAVIDAEGVGSIAQVGYATGSGSTGSASLPSTPDADSRTIGIAVRTSNAAVTASQASLTGANGDSPNTGFNVSWVDTSLEDTLDWSFTTSGLWAALVLEASPALAAPPADSFTITRSGTPYWLRLGQSQDIYTPDTGIVRAVISVHGLNRNFESALTSAEAVTVDVDGVLSVAPHFILSTDHTRQTEQLGWSSSWPEGGRTPADLEWRISSHDAIEELITHLRDTFVNLDEIHIIGHSAGGQFVTRFSMSSSSAGLKFLAGGAGSYAYPGSARWDGAAFTVPDPAPTGYDAWKYGVADLSSVAYISAIGAATLRTNLDAATVLYLVGALDNDPNHSELDVSDAAMAQGDNRLERAELFHDYLDVYFGGDVHDRHLFDTVADVGHSSTDVLQSDEARQWIVGDLLGASGTGSVSVSVSTSATGTRTAQGSGSASVSVSSTSTGQRTGQGVATAAIDVAASGTGVTTRLGSASSTVTVSASSTGQRIASGSASSTVTVSATSTGQRTAEASASSQIAVTATSTGLRTANGSGSSGVSVALSGAGERTTFGTGSTTVTVSASSTGQRTAFATGSASVSVAGSSTGQRFASGDGSATVSVSSIATGSAVGVNQGSGSTTVTVSAASTGQRTTFGTAASSVSVAGSSTGQRTTFGTASTLVSVESSTTGQRTAVAGGSTTVTVSTSGAGVATGAGEGAGTVNVDISSTATGQRTAIASGSVLVVVDADATGEVEPPLTGEGSANVTIDASGVGLPTRKGSGSVVVSVDGIATASKTGFGSGAVNVSVTTVAAGSNLSTFADISVAVSTPSASTPYRVGAPGTKGRIGRVFTSGTVGRPRE